MKRLAEITRVVLVVAFILLVFALAASITNPHVWNSLTPDGWHVPANDVSNSIGTSP